MSICLPHRGECVFLLGPSGSGKSTLLSIIGCVLTADRGDVRILGRDVTRLEPGRIGRSSVASTLDLCFNASIWSAAFGGRKRSRAADARGLAGRRAAPAGERTAGHGRYERKTRRSAEPAECRPVPACSFRPGLAADPELILADEPTASLDAGTGHQALELLRRLTADAGKTVIVVTHDPRILPFADRILHMENGRLEERTADGDLTLAAVALLAPS